MTSLDDFLYYNGIISIQEKKIKTTKNQSNWILKRILNCYMFMWWILKGIFYSMLQLKGIYMCKCSSFTMPNQFIFLFIFLSTDMLFPRFILPLFGLHCYKSCLSWNFTKTLNWNSYPSLEVSNWNSKHNQGHLMYCFGRNPEKHLSFRSPRKYQLLLKR